jgi:16S rRNA (cytosine967-C5)-methyltransferase
LAVDLARETALKILFEINEKGAYSNISINKYLGQNNLRDIDRGFVTELVYGTVKWKLALDWAIQQFSSIKFKKISPWILNILRIGIYQLLYMNRVPVQAACNESVKLAKRYGHYASVSFVNGVLRNIARNRDNIKYPDKDREYAKYLSIRYSHPEWMVRRFLELFGAGFSESLLESNNKVPDFTVRVNTLKTSSKELIELLRQEGMEASHGRYAKEAVIIKNPIPVSRIEAFKKGLFQIQDESSMMAARILDPEPGEFIIDVCSAPGGKTTHIAQLMNNRGKLLARDIHQHKIKLIEESCERLGISIIETQLYNALEVDVGLKGKADRVLVDAPCSGLGIIRRKPDIKWAKNIEDTEEVTNLQMGILNASSKYVKPGGVLVYSTCTVLPEENEHMVHNFIAANPDFKAEDISGQIPETLADADTATGCLKLFPNKHNVDGFFIARLRKRG